MLDEIDDQILIEQAAQLVDAIGATDLFLEYKLSFEEYKEIFSDAIQISQNYCQGYTYQDVQARLACGSGIFGWYAHNDSEL